MHENHILLCEFELHVQVHLHSKYTQRTFSTGIILATSVWRSFCEGVKESFLPATENKRCRSLKRWNECFLEKGKFKCWKHSASLSVVGNIDSDQSVTWLWCMSITLSAPLLYDLIKLKYIVIFIHVIRILPVTNCGRISFEMFGACLYFQYSHSTPPMRPTRKLSMLIYTCKHTIWRIHKSCLVRKRNAISSIGVVII